MAQAQALLDNRSDQYTRHLLAAELNVALNPDLGAGIYTFGSLSGMTVAQIVALASSTPSGSASSGLVDAVLYLGSDGEGCGHGCRVVTSVCGPTPTPVNTPTATPTGTVKPPCGTHFDCCGSISGPGYWKNCDDRIGAGQFLALIQATADFSALTVAQAKTILDDSSDPYTKHLLSAELNIALNPNLGKGTYSFGFAGLRGMTLTQICSLAYRTSWVSADLFDAVLYFGSDGDGAGQQCRITPPACN